MGSLKIYIHAHLFFGYYLAFFAVDYVHTYLYMYKCTVNISIQNPWQDFAPFLKLHFNFFSKIILFESSTKENVDNKHLKMHACIQYGAAGKN